MTTQTAGVAGTAPAPPAPPAAPAPPATSASTLREQFLDARRAEILEAARSVFIEKGCDAASMQQIAKAAGISAGNIYRYFPNKEALIVAVCEDCEIQDRAAFESVSEANASPLGALFAIGDDAFGKLDEAGSLQWTMLSLESALVAARNPDFGPAVERQTATIRDGLVALIEAAQEAGELDASVDARAFGELLLSVASGLKLLQLQMKDDVDAQGVWKLLQAMVRGFATEGVATELPTAS